MMEIPVGTPCWIIGVEPGNEWLLGRVVEVVAPAVPMAERGNVRMHRIDAAWLRLERPNFLCFAPPAHLRPLTPPRAMHTLRTTEPTVQPS